MFDFFIQKPTLLIVVLFAFVNTPSVYAQDTEDEDLFDMTLEDMLDLEIYDIGFNLYGYINSNVEKIFDFPSVDELGNTVKSDAPIVWDPVRAFHIYGSGNLSDRISVLFNLASVSGDIEVRNAWGNFKLKDALQFRIGKIYRRFGLYNEKLDQIPTFIGIEPPELFDNDHLLLSRTTEFMVHGALGSGFEYALTTGNNESGPSKGVFPLGWDFRYKNEQKKLIMGISG